MVNYFSQWFDKTHALEFIAMLCLRLYLAPVFWMAGTKKLESIDATIEWFGNSEWGLGLPAPVLLAWLAALTEVVGAVCLVLGLAVKLVSIPLMITMLVATLSVHWENGWLAIAGSDNVFATERTAGAMERLDKAREILQTHGHYEWLTENGSFVVLNNGVEFAVTYFVMLLVLFVSGAGRYVSMDYWISKKLVNRLA